VEVWSRNKTKRNKTTPSHFKSHHHAHTKTPNLQNQQQHGLIIIIIIIIILRSSSSSFSFSCCSNISNTNTNDSSNTYYRFQNEMVPRGGLGRLDMVQFGWVLLTIAGSSFDDDNNDNDDQYNYDEQWLGGGPGEGGRSFSS
jgi:hypothetical protein